jgi:hypothetical protein
VVEGDLDALCGQFPHSVDRLGKGLTGHEPVDDGPGQRGGSDDLAHQFATRRGEEYRAEHGTSLDLLSA